MAEKWKTEWKWVWRFVWKCMRLGIGTHMSWFWLYFNNVQVFTDLQLNSSALIYLAFASSQ